MDYVMSKARPYAVFLGLLAIMVSYALWLDTPLEILNGLARILVSKSVLITDYASVGGVGATLVNSAMVGLLAAATLIIFDIKPTGPIRMGLFLTIGFGFFGKNLFNMLPLSLGVMLYARLKKEPFRNYALASMLSATLSPVVSEIAFYYGQTNINLLAGGILSGIICGFIFPVVSMYVMRVHHGYNLYNMGFAGGIITMFIASVVKSVGVRFTPSMLWNTVSTIEFAIFLYVVSLYLILVALLKAGVKEIFVSLREMHKEPGRLPCDFYGKYGSAAYFNMGIMGLLFTTTVLFLRIDLNGATTGGILTILGFGNCGKHLKNTFPVLAGAVISSYVNMWDPTAPLNALAIIFSTGLAPIAGQFGWLWGCAAGFLHVNIVHHAGYLNNGLNLYNNGFAAGFVAMLLVPLILATKRKA